MIDSYKFGEIVIDGETYINDVIILQGKVVDWWRAESHTLRLDDLKEVLESKPEILVVGTGHDGMMEVLPEVAGYCRKNNIKLIARKTAAAVKDFNRNEAKAVAALHLTC